MDDDRTPAQRKDGFHATRYPPILDLAAALGLALGTGSIVPAAAQSVAESAMALLPQAPVEQDVPFILPSVTDVGSTAADNEGSSATSGTGVNVVIDGNMFGIE